MIHTVIQIVIKAFRVTVKKLPRTPPPKNENPHLLAARLLYEYEQHISLTKYSYKFVLRDFDSLFDPIRY